MAESLTRNFVSINCIDGINRACGNTFYVSNEDALAYGVAADDAARAATAVGILITRYLLITDAAWVMIRTGIEVLRDPAPSGLADSILRGNKLEFFRSAGGLRRAFEVPARKVGAFTQSGNSLEIATDAPTAMLNFVTQYNAVVLDLFENPCTIVSGKIVD